MKVIRTILSKKSILYANSSAYDYVDSYQTEIPKTKKELDITDCARAFFYSGPKCIGKLFEFRNKIVSFFGLKTSGKISNREEILNQSNFEVGDKLGLFKVFAKTESEIILGENDKHLDFRISLFLEGSTQRTLTISTTVIFNNWFGKLYFLPVKPFHKLVVPLMLKGIIKSFETK